MHDANILSSVSFQIQLSLCFFKFDVKFSTEKWIISEFLAEIKQTTKW